MRAWMPKVMQKPKPQMQLDLEMLMRAYDPCISCSVHTLKVQR